MTVLMVIGLMLAALILTALADRYGCPWLAKIAGAALLAALLTALGLI